MITLIYLLFNGYPSDTIVIPLTLLLTIVAVSIAIKCIKEDLLYEKNN